MGDNWNDEDQIRRLDDQLEFPLFDWKMKAIFDESNEPLDGEYWQEIRRKEGRHAEELYNAKMKKIDEKKLDWGYDILRTWDIQSILQDF